jgi:hypothetical protein
MVGIQGRSQDQRRFLDAESVVGQLIEPGSAFAVDAVVAGFEVDPRG